jgi:hypothetical protein
VDIDTFVAVSNIFCCLRKQTNELKRIGKVGYHVHSEAVDMTKKNAFNPKPIGDDFPKQLKPLPLF